MVIVHESPSVKAGDVEAGSWGCDAPLQAVGRQVQPSPFNLAWIDVGEGDKVQISPPCCFNLEAVGEPGRGR